MLTLTENARRRLMLIAMNDAREPIDASAPEVRELLRQGCLEVLHVRLAPYAADDPQRWVKVTAHGELAHAALTLSRPQ